MNEELKRLETTPAGTKSASGRTGFPLRGRGRVDLISHVDGSITQLLDAPGLSYLVGSCKDRIEADSIVGR